MGEKVYIVWNEAKTEGFVTKDYQLAYEVRKSADTNCFDADGKYSHLGATFCEQYFNENCTIETLEFVPISEVKWED